MSTLVLNNGVTRESYKERFPKAPVLRALDPWEQTALGYLLDVQQWELMEDFVYDSDRVGKLTIPGRRDGKMGFVTDLASIPQSLQNLLQNDSPCILCGAIVHDYLYTVAGELQSGGWATFRVVNKVLAECLWYSNARWHQIAGVYGALAFSREAKAKWNANCDRLGKPERKV